MSRWQWDGVVGYNGENDAWEAYLTYAMHAWAVFRERAQTTTTHHQREDSPAVP